MITRIVSVLLILNLLVSNYCYAEPSLINISSIRVWPSPASIRVVFDLSDAAEYKMYILTNPHRIAIDFKNTKLNSKLVQDLHNAISNSNSWITKIRTGIHPGATGSPDSKLRLVFELTDKVVPNVFALRPNDRYGHRLVLDLELSEKQHILAMFDLDELEKANLYNPGLVKTNSSVANNLSSNLDQKLVLAIDPGHGGEDPGAIGPRGTLEKDIVLQIAKLLKQSINNRQDMRAFLIRNGDYYVSLGDRMSRARQHKSDLFISLHADAFSNSKADGASVFVLSEQGSTSAAVNWLARSQNQSDTIGGVKLKSHDRLLNSVLLDLSQTANASASLAAAKNILLSMQKNIVLHKDQVEQANFMVLKAPDVPSVLIETGFISNPKTELKLRDRAYQKKIVSSIVKGIDQYFNSQLHTTR